MSNRTSVRVVAAFAAVFALSYAAYALAGPGGLKAKRAAGSSNVFCLSTVYTGYLGETLTIGGVQYRVGPNVQIYVNGEGSKPLGMMVLNRSIYISGEKRGKNMLVQTIMVRPVESDAVSSSGRPACGKVADPNPPM